MLFYFNDIAGILFSEFVLGSTAMPTFSNAPAPKIGSTSLGPKITYVTVFPMGIVKILPIKL